MDSGAAAKTVTLPTAADNNGRIITVMKVDTGAGTCIVDGEGAEVIQAATTFTLFFQYDRVTLMCNGTLWYVIECNSTSPAQSVTCTGTWVANSTYTGKMWRKGNIAVWDIKIALAGAPTSATLTVTLPAGYTIDTTMFISEGDNMNLGTFSILDGGNGDYSGRVTYASTTSVKPYVHNAASTYLHTDNGVTQALPITFGSTDVVYLRFETPIVEFAHFR